MKLEISNFCLYYFLAHRIADCKWRTLTRENGDHLHVWFISIYWAATFLN